MWRKEKSRAVFVGMQISAAIMENSMEVPQNINNGIISFYSCAFWHSNPTSENISKEQNTNLKEYMHPYVHCSAIWKLLKCPLADEWLKKLWYIYTVEYYGSIKKDTWPFETVWMDVESTMLSEISQWEKDKYYYYLTYMWNLMNKITWKTK